MSQNFRVASINRKQSRTNVQRSEENIFETNKAFVLTISSDDGNLSRVSEDNSKTSTPSEKPKANKLNLYSMKNNRTVIRSADHH
jgi:hypothetical protein